MNWLWLWVGVNLGFVFGVWWNRDEWRTGLRGPGG